MSKQPTQRTTILLSLAIASLIAVGSVPGAGAIDPPGDGAQCSRSLVEFTTKVPAPDDDEWVVKDVVGIVTTPAPERMVAVYIGGPNGGGGVGIKSGSAECAAFTASCLGYWASANYQSFVGGGPVDSPKQCFAGATAA